MNASARPTTDPPPTRASHEGNNSPAEPLPLTVILPNFNHEKKVGRAIRAILGQSVQPAALVVVDDGSTDGSLREIARAIGDAAHVRVLENGRNLGVERSFARGLELCETEYFCAVAADDEWLPGFLARIGPVVRAHPRAGLYLTDFAFRDPARGRLYPKHLGLGAYGFIHPRDVAARLARAGHILPAYGCVFRRKAIEEAGGFRPELRWHADWFVELAVAFRYGVGYVPETLAVTEVDATSYSTAGMRDWQRQRQVLHELLRLLETPEFADVAPYFQASNALGYFGLASARAAASLGSPGSAARWRGRLPWRAMISKSLKLQLIRFGGKRARQLYWTLRHRLRSRSSAPHG